MQKHDKSNFIPFHALLTVSSPSHSHAYPFICQDHQESNRPYSLRHVIDKQTIWQQIHFIRSISSPFRRQG
jgi:hypothetical protein